MPQRPATRKHPWATIHYILYLVPTALSWNLYYSDIINKPRVLSPSDECKLRPVPFSSFPSSLPHGTELISTASKLWHVFSLHYLSPSPTKEECFFLLTNVGRCLPRDVQYKIFRLYVHVDRLKKKKINTKLSKSCCISNTWRNSSVL
jgi:hypothetical protein